MVKLRSAVNFQLKAGWFGSEQKAPPIILKEIPLVSFTQISGWPDNFEKKIQKLLSVLGFSELGTFSKAQIAKEKTVFRVGPERILVWSSGAFEWNTIKSLADTNSLSFLDLSHARTIIQLEGVKAPDLLARLVSVDLNNESFPGQCFVLTAIHSVPVMLYRRLDGLKGPSFNLFIPYTWSASLVELICQTALPFGYVVKGPLPQD